MAAPVHVLIACEDKTLRKVYAKQMRVLGADVRAVRTAEDALAQTQRLRFDRVVCSEQLGQVDGSEVLRQISLLNEEAERVLLSELPSEWADRTIPTPFTFEVLKSLVSSPDDEPQGSVEERLVEVKRARDRRRRRFPYGVAQTG